MKPAYDKRRAIAWVCEDSGDPTLDEDPLLTLGLFTAHVETDQLSEGIDQGPARVPVEEAIAWARDRAARVIVRVKDSWENSFYSAGELPVLDEERPMKSWPEQGLDLEPRRSPGWEHVDRTAADDPIEWDVIVSWDCVARLPRRFRKTLERHLEDETAVRDVILRLKRRRARRGRLFVLGLHPRLLARLRVTSRTLPEARQLGKDACERAIGAALRSLSGEQPADLQSWNAEAFPTGSEAARINARID
ncbi:MAG: hypothetical protein ABR581_08080 [Thermoleophilaceae bacterium]